MSVPFGRPRSPRPRSRSRLPRRSRHSAPAPVAPAPVPPPASPTPPLDAPATPPTPVMPAAPAPVPPSTQTTSARVEWRLTVGAATVLALSTLLVFGAGVAVGQLALPVSKTQSPVTHGSTQGRPATASASAPAAGAAPIHETSKTEGLPVTTPSVTAAAPPAKPSFPSRVLPPAQSAQTRTETQHLKPTAAPARPVKQQSKTVRPIPNGGYAFFEGNFQLSADGRTLTGFTLRTSACAGPLVVPPIDVSPSGTFTYSGHPAGSLPGTSVRLTGRFVSRADARGTTQVTRGACHATATPFVAHLS